MIARVISLAAVRRLLDQAQRARKLADLNERKGGITGVSETLRAMARTFQREAIRAGVDDGAAPTARVGISVRELA